MARRWQKTKKIALWGLLAMALVALLLTAALGVAAYKANHLRLPEALLKAPLAPPPPRAAAPRPAIAPVAQLKLPQDATMGDYLRLCLARDPGLQSVSLYLQLMQRYRDDRIAEQVDKLLYDKKKFENQLDPPPPEGAAWLSGETATFDLLHRFCHADPLPALTFDEASACVEKYPGLSRRGIDDDSIQQFTLMLLANAHRLAAERAYPQARQALEDVILLTGQYLQTRKMFIGAVTAPRDSRGSTMKTARKWVEQPDFPLAELRPLAATLESYEREFLTPQWGTDHLTEDYLLERQWIIGQMAYPTWRCTLYGWFYTGPDGRTDYPTLQLGTRLKIPHPGALAEHSVFSIRNRLHAAEALQKFDLKFLDAIARLKEPYAKIRAHNSELVFSPWHAEDFLLRATNPPDEWADVLANDRYGFQTSIHLFRLAVALRSDPAAALALRTAAPGDPHNPWRDPLSGGLMQIDDPVAPTMAWCQETPLKPGQRTPDLSAARPKYLRSLDRVIRIVSSGDR